MFSLGDFAIDRMVGLVAEQNKEISYVLKQCQEGSISISSESTDIVDKNGTLVRRTYKAKTGELTITNAMLNINALNAASGSDIKTGEMDMPKFQTIAGGSAAVKIDASDAATIRVKEFANNGASGASIEKDTAADAIHYAYDESTGEITVPTDATKRYVVKYMRTVEDGAMIKNESNKFPGGCELTIKALYVDPCEIAGVKACYIYCPNFQVSPETTIPLTAGETFDLTGALATSYCGDEQLLYAIYFPDELDEDIL